MALTKRQWQHWKEAHPRLATMRAAKISAAHKGKRLSGLHKRAISRAMVNRPLSDSHRAAISRAMQERTASKLNYRLAVIAVLLAIALVAVWSPDITSFTTAKFDWTKSWENRYELVIDSSAESINYHVAFGAHRMANCSNNIAVMTDTHLINFEVENATYDNNNMCAETDIKFRNIYYQPYFTTVVFVPPTPANNSYVNNSWVFVNLTSGADATLAVLEIMSQERTRLEPMAGFNANWWYNLTNLSEGNYSFRAQVEDAYGNVNVSDIFTFYVNYGAPAGKVIIEQPFFTAAPVKRSITYYVYYGRIPANITTVKFVEPTPSNATIITEDAIFVNVTTNADATLALLEVNGLEQIRLEPMAGSNTNWWYTLTNLADGSYTLRAYVNDTLGNIVASQNLTIIVAASNITNYSKEAPPLYRDILPITREGFAYGSEKYKNKVYFEGAIGKGKGVEFAVDDGSATWQLQRMEWSDKINKQDITPAKEFKIAAEDNDNTTITVTSADTAVFENKIKYKNILSIMDIEYIYSQDLLKENIIVANSSALPAPKDLAESITLDVVFGLDWSEGLDVIVAGSSWDGSDTMTNTVLFRKDGKFIFSFLQPYATDATGSRVDAMYELTQQGKKTFISIQVPYDWLANANYPVIIDPTMSSSQWNVSEVVALGGGRSDSAGGNFNVTMVPGEPVIGESSLDAYSACLGFFCTSYDITGPVIGVPTFNVSNPTNINTNVEVNATWSDDLAVSSCNYVVSGATTISSTAMTLYNSTSSYSQGTASAFITDTLNDGANTFTVTCKDTSDNTGSNNAVLNVDTIKPTITFVPPTPDNAATINTNWVYVNTTVDGTGTNVDTCQLEWEGANASMTKSATAESVVCYKNKTGLADGTYTYKVYATDSATNMEVSETRTVTINTQITVSDVIVDDEISYPADKIDLLGNNTRTVWCNATFNNPAGASYLDSAWARVYDSAAGGNDTCTGDNNNCYWNSSCTLTAYNSTAKIATCAFAFWYNAENSSDIGWLCNITANDTAGNTASGTDTTQVTVLLSIHVDDNLDFGTVDAGTNQSYCAENHTTWNYGNTQIDLEFNGSALDCSTPYIDVPASYVKFNCTDWNQSYSTGCRYLTAVSSESTQYCNAFDSPKNSTATTQEPTAPSKKTYWGVGAIEGSGGTCSGTVYFIAVPG